jgi:ABC-2 type transport system ATP-binding protein
MIIVSTDRLSKSYHSGFLRKTAISALVDASLSVSPGEIFGLLGPNGAGKTTFVKILLSVVLPSSGSAQLLGKEIGDPGVRRRCGYLPENHRYPGFLTAFETLLFFGGLNGMRRSALKDRARQLLEFVGLKEWENRRVQKFSKGMLQRLGLAQALLGDPEILFLDEPTDGVDPIGRKEMRDLFLSLKKNGTTIFLNSHLLSEVEMISDRVAILNKGAIIKVGTLDEVRGGPSTHQIHISGSLSPDQLQAIKPHADVITSDTNDTILSLKIEGELNSTIDLLRLWGVKIKSINQQKTSLEDSFMKLVLNERAP